MPNSIRLQRSYLYSLVGAFFTQTSAFWAPIGDAIAGINRKLPETGAQLLLERMREGILNPGAARC
jgi:hypothetical protein